MRCCMLIHKQQLKAVVYCSFASMCCTTLIIALLNIAMISNNVQIRIQHRKLNMYDSLDWVVSEVP